MSDDKPRQDPDRKIPREDPDRRIPREDPDRRIPRTDPDPFKKGGAEEKPPKREGTGSDDRPRK
jgi:hypothetical protein